MKINFGIRIYSLPDYQLFLTKRGRESDRASDKESNKESNKECNKGERDEVEWKRDGWSLGIEMRAKVSEG